MFRFRSEGLGLQSFGVLNYKPLTTLVALKWVADRIYWSRRLFVRDSGTMDRVLGYCCAGS